LDHILFEIHEMSLGIFLHKLDAISTRKKQEVQMLKAPRRKARR